MISVIVPVHNIEAYLSRCLDSILDQTERDIEIIIIDDGSDDSSPFIIDSYASADERIRVLRTAYRGVSSARNTGIREAKGEYIGFVDADDFAEPDMFEALRSRLEETCSDVSFCGFINEYPLRSVPSAVYEKVYSGEEVMKAFALGEINNLLWNKLFKKELFYGIEFPEGHVYEDIYTVYKLIGKAGKAAGIALRPYHYFQRPDSVTKSRSMDSMMDYYLSVHKRAMAIEETGIGTDDGEVRKALDNSYASVITEIWRWAHTFPKDDRKRYLSELEDMSTFMKEHYPASGSASWPKTVRMTSFFTRSTSGASFALCHFLNGIAESVKDRRGG